jgi:hypothetical protein
MIWPSKAMNHEGREVSRRLHSENSFVYLRVLRGYEEAAYREHPLTAARNLNAHKRLEDGMRQTIGFCAVLFVLSGLAMGQVTVFSGYASNWTPGAYARPFVPMVTTPYASPDAVATPSIQLGTVSLATGARNATAQNMAGAANATVTIPSTAAGAGFVPPRGFQFGAAIFQSSYGAAQLMARPSAHARRTYTNQDVTRVNDTNGLVKVHGKTEHLD